MTHQINPAPPGERRRRGASRGGWRGTASSGWRNRGSPAAASLSSSGSAAARPAARCGENGERGSGARRRPRGRAAATAAPRAPPPPLLLLRGPGWGLRGHGTERGSVRPAGHHPAFLLSFNAPAKGCPSARWQCGYSSRFTMRPIGGCSLRTRGKRCGCSFLGAFCSFFFFSLERQPWGTAWRAADSQQSRTEPGAGGGEGRPGCSAAPQCRAGLSPRPKESKPTASTRYFPICLT